MELQPKVRSLVLDRGYKSLLEFAEENELSYYLLRKLANNKANAIDVNLLIGVCEALDCEVGELLVLKK